MQGETRDEEPEQAILQPADKRAEAAPTASADDTTLPPSFSIAVLAFNNMSDDRELDWVADGLSEDIITKLGKASILNVAARNSSFVWKGTSPDIREVGRELTCQICG
jgi:adenylate cyclase